MYADSVAEKVSPFVLRLPPDLHAAIQVWAREEERSMNAQIVYLLRQAVAAHKS
jgi:hypothetical protein